MEENSSPVKVKAPDERGKLYELYENYKSKLDYLTKQVESGALSPNIWAEKVRQLFGGKDQLQIHSLDKRLIDLDATVRTLQNNIASKLLTPESVKPQEFSSLEKRIEDLDATVRTLQSNVTAKNSEPSKQESEEPKRVAKKNVELKNYWDTVYDKLKDSKRPVATGNELKTGFVSIDEIMGGLSGISMLYGPPKIGKTSLALQTAFEMVANNDSFLIYYTTDNRPESLFCRLIAQLSGINPSRIYSGQVEKFDDIEKKIFWQSTDFINSMSCRIFVNGIDSVPHSYEEFASQIEDAFKQTGSKTGLIVIDSYPIFSLSFSTDDQIDRMPISILRDLQFRYNISFLLTLYEDPTSDFLKMRYMADNILDMQTPTAKHSANGKVVVKDNIVNLQVTSRDFGEFAIPLTFSRESLVFTVRTKVFKARKVAWNSKKNKPEPEPAKEEMTSESLLTEGETYDAFTELLQRSASLIGSEEEEAQ